MGKKDKSKSPTSSPNIDSEQDQKVHKKFHLDPQEKVLFVIKCRKKSRNGEMIITEEHICFSSTGIGMGTKKKVLAFNQISQVDNLEKNGGVRVTTKTGKPITFHFKQNESVYLLIEGQWELTGNQPGSRLNLSQQSVTTSHSKAPINQKSIHKHFQLPESEVIQLEESCSLKSTVKFKHYGKLFITQNYLCFYSSFLTSSTKRIVKLRNITSIEKEKTKVIIISTTTEHYKFSTFQNRDETFQELTDLHEKAKLDTTSLPSTPNLNLSRSGSNNDLASHDNKRNSLDVNQLQDTLEKTKRHSRQNSDNNNNSQPIFKKVHSRQNSDNLNQQQISTATTTTTTTTTPTSSTPKQHSRQNSSNNNSTPPTTSTSVTTTTPTTTSKPPIVNQPQQNTNKIGNRLEKVDNVIPKVDNVNKKETSQTQETKTKYRSCCFGMF
ncbi:RasGEF domain-containing protein [Tieghemostelium lacteum]|uniref:RasGEF domain-containing protein n=1 Tax=Tieghemostelium lacteum TaxID=361077 RepID=A0A151ZIM4_TIELA|nr:RasGEF domain-containing protein [Tieghemostelium lacteum]|eukprot:KYQ93842.1 RasGEF domain-containing protein [Tieghemostelium lacteum]